ncbi:MBL fold metallo-hydrolase [Crassaminicella thermophila]|uniref:MBL fold metallo-hydrolase n=1 Tax=Crassaminicella thermophila TaxID=2599308 RepID=A0A5C0SG69_CRATE|nr:MBL fold metallo-hydrolase [Crassaminicella thermophila]
MTITTLIENNLGKDKTLYNEHGLSFFIEGENFNILYDTGQSNKFIDNAKKLNIDLSKTTHVVLSHGHYDHTGGFKDFVVNTNASFDLYISKYFFRKKYSIEEDTCKYLGPNFDEAFLKEKNIKLNYITNDIEIAPNVVLSTNFKRKTPFETISPRFYVKEGKSYVKDDFKDEIVLSIQTKKGLIVLLGCSHPGVVNILDSLIQRTKKPIYAIIGGTHLVEGNKNQLKSTLDYFKKISIKHIGVSHCTGEAAIKELKQFDCFFENCTGTQIQINSHNFSLSIS